MGPWNFRQATDVPGGVDNRSHANIRYSAKFGCTQLCEQARFVADLGASVVELFAPRQGERIFRTRSAKLAARGTGRPGRETDVSVSVDIDGTPVSAAAQRWDARKYAEHARFVAELGLPAVELLAPRPGEHILDLGCGDGVLTAQLARTGAAVVGIDSSPELVAAARAAGIDARFMDARQMAFEGEFDAVFSNAALHWVLEPEQVVRGVKRALRPHGRFVGEFGGHGNVAAIRTALAAVLQAHGLAVAAVVLSDRR